MFSVIIHFFYLAIERRVFKGCVELHYVNVELGHPHHVVSI